MLVAILGYKIAGDMVYCKLKRKYSISHNPLCLNVFLINQQTAQDVFSTPGGKK